MAEPFLSEIRLMSFSFAPKGWAACNGQLIPVTQNPALFALLGTTFGGDGRVTFALPDLRGRVPVHVGGGWSLGTRGGESTHTLSFAEMPSHTHAVNASGIAGNVAFPTDNLLSLSSSQPYAAPMDLMPLTPDSVGAVGSDAAHENMQPFLTLNFCIALQGIFPVSH